MRSLWFQFSTKVASRFLGSGTCNQTGKPKTGETLWPEFVAIRAIRGFESIRIQQFPDGGRDFDDAITVEEYLVPVTVNPDGTITDENSNKFGPFVE